MNPISHIYLTQYDDRLFRRVGEQGLLLYDFSKQVGDTLNIPIVEDEIIYDFFVQIDSARLETVDGDMRRAQLYRPLLEINEHPSNAYQYNGWVIEGIGSTSYIHPINQLDCDGSCPDGLRCFSNVSVDFTTTDLPCDTIGRLALGVSTYEIINDQLSISPNPVSVGRTFQISLSDGRVVSNPQISLMNLMGVSLRPNMTESNNRLWEIETNELSTALYHVLITTDDLEVYIQKIVIVD